MNIDTGIVLFQYEFLSDYLYRCIPTVRQIFSVRCMMVPQYKHVSFITSDNPYVYAL